MNKLVEEIVKPILEDNPKIKKVVGIYGGRFQPFGPHHYKTYKWLDKQVDVAYITTSNIKKPPRHPMNFKEKTRHMSKMGVPSSKIIQEKTPYVANNVMKKFDPKTTAVVYIFGKKDAGRLKGGRKTDGGLTYYQDFKKNKNNLKGYEEHGYILTAPHVSISVGGKEVSGTAMRELLGSPKLDDSERAKLFKKMFGYFNQGIFNMLTNKFKKLFEATSIVKDDEEELEEWYPSDEELDDFEKKLSKHMAKKYKGDGHTKGIAKLKELDVPIKIGDTVLMGKFKNKKVTIKSIKWNEKGDLLINGKPALKFRIMKEFYEKIPLIIKEASVTSGGGFDDTDDGPSFGYGNFRTYRKRNMKEANKLGWDVVNYLLKPESKKWKDYPEYPNGPVKAVSYGPAGAGSGRTPNNQVDLFGNSMWNEYQKHIDKVATTVGMELIDFLYGVDEDLIKLIGLDAKETLKRGDDETPQPESKKKDSSKGSGKDKSRVNESFSKDWWMDLLTEGKKEYVIWGIPPGKRDEEILYTKAKSNSEAKKIIKILVKKHGVKKARVQVLDLTQDPSKFWKSDNMFEGLILEGGAYGHMAHPFDDKDLTFGDLKKIIELGLGGHLNREDGVTEKLDGQNIMVSWKDGKLIAARNKGHIKNGGKTALTTKGIASKFAGRGDIADAFNFAMKDLERAIKGLSDKQKEKIFNNGYNFMNLEVMWPKSANVIDYDKAELVFHGALKYDDSGKVIGEVPGSGRILAGMIKQINMHIGKKYSIGKPVFLTVPKHQDFGKMKSKFLGKLNKLQSEFGLKSSDELSLYHQKWWESFISKKNKKISSKVLKGLVKRWAFFDKSYAIKDIKKDIKDEKFLEWVLKFDKENHASQVKKNMKPFEILFFQVGAEIMKNMSGFMAANPNKAVQGIRKRLKSAISNVKKGGDLKKLNTLKAQLEKFNAIGGTKAIVPSEGIVFKYKGKTYKFTGAFAPVNQITGLISF